MPKNPNRILADNLRALRGLWGWSQEELAARCRLHRTYIGAIERGERNITLDTLFDIAIATEVPTAELITEEGLDQKQIAQSVSRKNRKSH